jgi:hypothetical protein
MYTNRLVLKLYVAFATLSYDRPVMVHRLTSHLASSKSPEPTMTALAWLLHYGLA